MSYNTSFKDVLHDDKNIKGFQGEYRWLSNFYPCAVKYKGFIFNSVENAYQAAKCDNEDDEVKFLSLTAGEAKKLGRKVKIREDWADIRVLVMKFLLRQKFSNDYLRELLLNTKDKYIEETNWWGDTFWGVCRRSGENMLGRLIMQIRTDLCHSTK